MQELADAIPLFIAQIGIGIMPGLFTVARTNLKQHGLIITAVDDGMPVRHTSLESGTVTGPQHRLTFILDQHNFTRDDNDKLIVNLVPVAQCRARLGWQHHPVHPHLRQPSRITNALTDIARSLFAEWSRIDQTPTQRNAGQINLWHGRASY